jgi:hypothetical protein
MPKAHVIIGAPDTRKSSLMRCLTGVRISGVLEIRLVSGRQIDVYCRPGSLQEGNAPLSPADFISMIGAMTPIPSDLLIALRVAPRIWKGTLLPGAAGYLSAFRAQPGWTVRSVALLGTGASVLATGGALPAATRLATAPASAANPANETASTVRSAWGWR